MKRRAVPFRLPPQTGGISPERTVLAYPASDIASVPAAPLPTEISDQPFLLYVGPRTKYKNFSVLLDAFVHSDWLRRAVQVVCLGGGPFREPELSFMREHGLLGRFHQLNGDDHVLKALYQKAVALAWTSRYEGFGIPPLEAMQVGCPVVCAPTSSMPEVVGDAALFFDPDQPDDLAEQLSRVSGDSALRARLIEQGHARAGLFSWDQMVGATLDGYRRLVH